MYNRGGRSSDVITKDTNVEKKKRTGTRGKNLKVRVTLRYTFKSVKVGGVVVTTLVQGSVVGRYETKM
jgi:hypothetical protein